MPAPQQLRIAALMAAILFTSPAIAQRGPSGPPPAVAQATARPTLQQVNRVQIRINDLEDQIAVGLAMRPASGISREIADAMIGLQMVTLRWYERGQREARDRANAPDRNDGPWLVFADQLYAHLKPLSAALAELSTPPASGPGELPQNVAARKAQYEQRLAGLTLLVQTTQHLTGPESGSLQLADQAAILGRALASAVTVNPTTATQPAGLPAGTIPGAPTPLPRARSARAEELEEGLARLARFTPQQWQARLAASKLSQPLRDQLGELGNLVALNAADPQLRRDSLALLDRIETTFQNAAAVGEAGWLTSDARQGIFGQITRGLILIRNPPTQENGRKRLDQANRHAAVVLGIAQATLSDAQRSALGQRLDLALRQINAFDTMTLGESALKVMENFTKAESRFREEAQTIETSSETERAVRSARARYEAARTQAVSSLTGSSETPDAAAAPIALMNAAIDDLRLLADATLNLARVEPYHRQPRARLVSELRTLADAVGDGSAARPAAAQRLQALGLIAKQLDDFRQRRLSDAQAASAFTREVTAGNYPALIEQAEALAAEAVAAWLRGEDPSNALKSLAEPIALLSTVQTAVAIADATRMAPVVNRWVAVYLDEGLERLNARWINALKLSFDQRYARRPQTLTPEQKTEMERVLKGYAPAMIVQAQLYSRYAARLAGQPDGIPGLIAQFANARQALQVEPGRNDWSAASIAINDAIFAEQIGLLDHVIEHLKRITPRP